MKKVIMVLMLALLVLPGCGATEKDRHDYAYTVESSFQDRHINVNAEATGDKATVLEVSANAVIIGVKLDEIKAHPEDFFDLDALRKLGFKKIIGKNLRGRVFFDIDL